MAFEVWSFVGGNVTGVGAMHAAGRAFLKGAEGAVRDPYEDRPRPTDAQRQAPDDALVAVTDMCTGMREQGADKFWEVRQNFRAKHGLGGTNRGIAFWPFPEMGTEIKVVKLEMPE